MTSAGSMWHTSPAPITRKILWWIWCWTVIYTSDDCIRPPIHCGDWVQTSQSKGYSFLQTSHFSSNPWIKEWKQLLRCYLSQDLDVTKHSDSWRELYVIKPIYNIERREIKCPRLEKIGSGSSSTLIYKCFPAFWKNCHQWENSHIATKAQTEGNGSCQRGVTGLPWKVCYQ